MSDVAHNKIYDHPLMGNEHVSNVWTYAASPCLCAIVSSIVALSHGIVDG